MNNNITEKPENYKIKLRNETDYIDRRIYQ